MFPPHEVEEKTILHPTHALKPAFLTAITLRPAASSSRSSLTAITLHCARRVLKLVSTLCPLYPHAGLLTAITHGRRALEPASLTDITHIRRALKPASPTDITHARRAREPASLTDITHIHRAPQARLCTAPAASSSLPR